MSTLAEIKSGLIEYLKCDPNDKIWSEAQKNSYINKAYLRVQKDGNFNWGENQADVTTITTATGTEFYNLPSDFIRLDLVQLANVNWQLGTTNKKTVMMMGVGANSQPSQYYIYGNQIGFYPRPDNAYTVNLLYRKRLPTMTSSVDCAFVSDFDEAIIKYAAYQIWSTTKNSAKAGQAIEDYKMALDTLKMAYQVQDSQDFRFGYQKFNNRPANFPRTLSF